MQASTKDEKEKGTEGVANLVQIWAVHTEEVAEAMHITPVKGRMSCRCRVGSRKNCILMKGAGCAEAGCGMKRSEKKDSLENDTSFLKMKCLYFHQYMMSYSSQSQADEGEKKRAEAHINILKMTKVVKISFPFLRCRSD